MAKLPFMKFYPLDWIRDTRELSLLAKGLWIDVLCFMWNEPERGVYKRSVRDACRGLGCSESELVMAAKELGKVANVTIGNDDVMLMSRRIVREQKRFEMNVNRVSRFRMKRKCNAPVTVQTLDVRCQTLQTSEHLTSRKEDRREVQALAFSPPSPAPEFKRDMTPEEMKKIRIQNLGVRP